MSGQARSVVPTNDFDDEGQLSFGLVDSEQLDDDLYAKEREGFKRCPDNITACFKAILGAGNGRVKKIESWVASIFIGIVVVACGMINCYHVHQIISTWYVDKHVYAIYISRAVNDLTLTITVFLICLVWHSLCFKNKSIKGMWAMEGSLVSNVMTGGFFPRPAAAGMGLLLFVNQTMLKTVTTTAVTFESCVANSIELDEVTKWVPAQFWFQRFYRDYPIGCYNVGLHPVAKELDEAVGSSDYTADAYRTGFLVSSLPQANGALNATWAKDNLLHPLENGVPNYNKWCSYTCSDFHSVSVSDLFLSVGTIFAGAAVVTKFTDMITSLLGWKLLEKSSSPADLVRSTVGVYLPNEDELQHAHTDHEYRDELVHELRTVHKRRPGSAVMCAMQLFGAYGIARFFTPHIALDGYFTVDYFTTLLMVTSVLIASMLRFYSPYTCRSVIYTKHLWSEGKDTFPVLNEETQKFEDVELDLYDWLHLPDRERNLHLLHKCRAFSRHAMKDLYTTDGIKPVDETAAEDDANADSTPLVNCALGTLSKIYTCLSYIFCPCRLFRPAVAVVEEREKYQCFVATDIDIEWEVEYWTLSDHQNPFLTKNFHRGRVQRERRGTIERLSDKDGEVIVSFGVQFDKKPICMFMDKDGKATGPVAPNAGSGWEFSLPLSVLRESTPEWSFIRKLLGDEPLSKGNHASE